jgi:hypothetical protein
MEKLRVTAFADLTTEPFFQSLTPIQQKKRLALLHEQIEQLQSIPPERLSSSEIGIRTAQAIEYCFLGVVEGPVVSAKTAKKVKAVKR